MKIRSFSCISAEIGKICMQIVGGRVLGSRKNNPVLVATVAKGGGGGGEGFVLTLCFQKKRSQTDRLLVVHILDNNFNHFVIFFVRGTKSRG